MTGAAAVGSSTASAADACDEGTRRLCLYENTYFQGGVMKTSSTSITNLANTGFNDRASSIRNNTGQSICFYVDSNYRNKWIKVDSGNHRLAFRGADWDMNDRISSFRPC
ncbi:peptidase inhibitor family I36 protein [Lentzea alba]|uniref:peptidase inhibitor family I36 protein n=1 Tax=Lentzea alba TaxID=2714351 RepID=UPI0039BF4958